jgi:hypothetical protein
MNGQKLKGDCNNGLPKKLKPTEPAKVDCGYDDPGQQNVRGGRQCNAVPVTEPGGCEASGDDADPKERSTGVNAVSEGSGGHRLF